jgi:hypothetical protein
MGGNVMRNLAVVLSLTASLTLIGQARAEEMTGDELRALLANGLTMTLGGPTETYDGELRLEPDGKGTGYAVFESGKKIDITGTWEIKGDQFCRKWTFNEFKEKCETWNKIDEKRVEVISDDGSVIGINSW